MTISPVDTSVLGKPVTFRNGIKAPNVFLKVSGVLGLQTGVAGFLTCP